VGRGEPPPRQALVGAAIAGAFGGLWAIWGGTGLDGPAQVVVHALGLVLGLAVAVSAGVLAARARPGSGGDQGDGSMFASRAYRVIVVIEVVAIVVGNVLLARAGLEAYVIAWTAFVVGVHFLAFGRAFDRVFAVIGALMVLGAVAGVVVGVLGAGEGAILLVTGLVSAVVLLGAGARTVIGGLGARAR
jgi:hypothetical protein